jgi:hypothetical protein
MKRLFLVIIASAMLVTLGFTQTPDTGGNMVAVNVNGCLGGSEGNYVVVEDGTGRLFKTTSSAVDLKTHLNHDVKLTGQKTTGAADNSLAVTELSMISERCTAATAAAPAVTVDPSPQTSIPPDAPASASAPAPDAAAAPAPPPSAAATAPAVGPAAPAATVNPAPAPTIATAPAQATIATPAAETAAPPTTVSPSAATATARLVEADPVPRPSAHARKLPAKQAAGNAPPATTVNPAPDTVSPAIQDSPIPATTAAPSTEAVSPPDAAAVSPVPVATHKAGSLTLLVSFVVLVIVLGTTAPLIGRWRKRKMLERDGTPNLSFTNEVGVNDVITNEASTNKANSGRDNRAPRKIA